MDCELCRTKVEITRRLVLCGTEKAYNIDVCCDCYDIYIEHFEPKEVDCIIKRCYR